MKDFDTFKIIERDDILTACQHMETFCKGCEAEMVKNDQEDVNGMVAAFRADVNMLLTAAGVAAEIANHQGGLAVVPEGLTTEQQLEVKKQLDKLRKAAAAPVQ